MTLVLTYPGVPSIFAGDEIGLEGAWGEDARRTINWEDRSGWDHQFMSDVKSLISIRKNNDALVNGGLRWIVAENDYIVYLRESAQQSVLVLVSRTAIDVTVDLTQYGYTVSKTLFGEDAAGSVITIKSSEAVQGIWEVKS
jgi:alpha-glucosidase